MAENIEFVVLGHYARREQAASFAESLGAHLLVDEYDRGAHWNQHRALEWAAGRSCRVVMLENDATGCRVCGKDG